MKKISEKQTNKISISLEIKKDAPKNMKIRYCIVKDQDCHKYRIPFKMKKQFETECEEAYRTDEFEEFEKKYSMYMFG